MKMEFSYSYDAFISYNCEEDFSNVKNMVNFLHKNNLEIWFDADQIKGTRNFPVKTKEAIDQSKFFICCVTDNYCDFEDSNNTEGYVEADIKRRFNAVGFRIAGNSYHKYNESNLVHILNAIKLNKNHGNKSPLKNYLPNLLNEYTTRQILEDKIKDLLEKYRLILITGPSGIGKTTLAVNYGLEKSRIKTNVVRFIPSETRFSISNSLISMK
ncbi:hypothetical protein BpHYR1_002563 [Brachionus plicatilis]|uniref:TIR domain-containing protein n=1 Tax=Brachionus plicatilis TaxID=10195 RepID=A0A3M7RGH8_BRAPC|nr:hypothetical protein BpHYR1_002563 [Brachionus plicatilis]